MGYAWCSHTSSTLPQRLRLCLSTTRPLQWAEPFAVDSVGVCTLQVPMGLSVARAYVVVSSTGGLQRQVREVLF